VVVVGLKSAAQVDVGGSKQPAQRGQGRLHPPGFDTGDHRLGDAGSLGQLRLGPATLDPCEPQQVAGQFRRVVGPICATRPSSGRDDGSKDRGPMGAVGVSGGGTRRR